MTAPLPRRIASENIVPGDTIRVVWVMANDVTVSQEGTVARIIPTNFGTEYVTAKGGIIFRYRAGYKPSKRMTFTLLVRAPYTQETLFNSTVYDFAQDSNTREART